MYYGRFDARALAKTILAGVIVLGVMLATGMYATYPDLVTPTYAGTVALWAFLSFCVRKMMS